MSKLNKTVKTDYTIKSHKNYMNGNSWDLSNPFVELRMVAASCFFGEPQYYKVDGSLNITNTHINCSYEEYNNYLHEMLGGLYNKAFISNNAQNTIEQIIDKCLNIDVEKTLQIAVSLRNEDYIRSTPQVILVRAAMHKNCKGTGLITKYGKYICTRGDEPAAGLSYFIATYTRKTAIPNSLKKLWKFVLESFDDYTLSKYRMDNNFVKTRDVVRLVHANSSSINKLMTNQAKQTNTWNTIISNSDNSNYENKQKKLD